MRLAVLAALPRELADIIKTINATKDRQRHPIDIYRASYGSSEVLLAITGMGTAKAESAAAYLCKTFQPQLVISAGYGGALYDGAAIGDIVWGTKCLLVPEFNQVMLSGEEAAFEKLSAEIPARKGTILTLPALMKKAELLDSLTDEFLNPVCDMETFAVASACIQNEVHFVALRSITDLKHEDIPSELFGISDESGNYSIITAIRIFLSKPTLLPVAIGLGINSQKATKTLTRAVWELLKILK